MLQTDGRPSDNHLELHYVVIDVNLGFVISEHCCIE